MVDGPLMLRVAFPDSGRRVIVKASNVIEFNVSVTVHLYTTYTNDLSTGHCRVPRAINGAGRRKAPERGARGVHGRVGPVRCSSLTRVCRGSYLRGVFERGYRDRT